jgi:CRISPR-associated protein Cmr5
MQTVHQKHAQDVYDCVEAFGKEYPQGTSERTQYGSMAHRFPVLVRQAGLMQALAFVETRGKAPHKQLLEDLAQVMSYQSTDKLVGRCREAPIVEYMWLTRQTLSALEWFKRFAESVLKVEAGMDKEA